MKAVPCPQGDTGRGSKVKGVLDDDVFGALRARRHDVHRRTAVGFHRLEVGPRVGRQVFHPGHAASGFFQKSLPGNVSAQLVRVGIPSDGGVYAEISGGKHRFSVRFMECNDWQHPTQVDRNIAFTLSTCAI